MCSGIVPQAEVTFHWVSPSATFLNTGVHVTNCTVTPVIYTRLYTARLSYSYVLQKLYITCIATTPGVILTIKYIRVSIFGNKKGEQHKLAMFNNKYIKTPNTYLFTQTHISIHL